METNASRTKARIDFTGGFLFEAARCRFISVNA